MANKKNTLVSDQVKTMRNIIKNISPDKIEFNAFKCTRCEYEWFPRIIDGMIQKPDHCSHCKSPYWFRPKLN